MPLSLESRFLLNSLRTFIGGDPGSLDLDTADQLNAERLLAAAHFHRVAPLVYKTASKLDPKHLPAAILEHFRRDVHAITLRSLLLTAEMLRLLNLFEAENIPAVAFKGPVLSMDAYGDPFARQFDDIDLLVRTSDFERSRAFLRSQGYTDHGVLTHACGLIHSQRRVALDLHRWILGPIGFAGTKSVTITTESLLARSGYLSFRGHSIRAFRMEDQLLVLCIHGAKHAWQRWIWLFDIGALIARNPLLDWDELAKRAQEFGIVEPVYLSLRLTETVCGRALPPGALKLLPVRPAIEELISPLDAAIVQDPDALRSELRRYLLPFQTLRSGRDKRKYFWRLLKERIALTSADRSMLSLPRYLEFLYFVIRPIRLTWQYGANTIGYAFRKLRSKGRIDQQHTDL